MKYLSADLLYTLAGEPILNGVVQIGDDGVIIRTGTRDEFPAADIEIHQGAIVPGFINTHCHLELSHMKGVIPEGLGMAGFIGHIISGRGHASAENVQAAIARAEQEMVSGGIVAVGDISNLDITSGAKQESSIRFFTFAEVFSLDPVKADDVFAAGLALERSFTGQGLEASVSPHAPYTMSEKLLRKITMHVSSNDKVISIHNQESKAESELFEDLNGPIYDKFLEMGIPAAFMRRTGKNSLRSTLPLLQEAEKIILVHNTFTDSADLEFASELHNNLFWCTCPRANLYIEGKLPDYDVFLNSGKKVVIGTDSLASNSTLSILDEMKVISEANTGISLETLLHWACKNGAEALGYEDLGTIESGKRPGINLLQGLKKGKLTNGTTVRRLL
jgi:cytosine/adenosine deaminase-related metal-dependent hydrolase